MQDFKMSALPKGSVHKRRLQSGEGFQCGHFADKEVLQMCTSALFGAKNIRFFKICAVFARTRGSIFRNFARAPFMHGPYRKN